MDEDTEAVKRVAQELKADAEQLAGALTGVPLVELAAHLGASLEDAARYIGEQNVRVDWAGRPSVPVELAARAISASQREQASNLAKMAAARAAEARWDQRRTAAGNAAYQKAHDAQVIRDREEIKTHYAPGGITGLSAIRTTATARAAGREARQKALEEFDRHPPRDLR